MAPVAGRAGVWRLLSLAQVQVLMTAIFGIGRDQQTALQARLKHMQLIKFPTGTGFKKGHRASYTLEHAMRFSVAFALSEAGMPAGRACSLTLENWDLILPAMASGLAHGGDIQQGPEDILFAEVHALARMGRSNDKKQSALEKIRLTSRSRPGGGDLDRDVENSDRRPFAATGVTVDLRQLVDQLAAKLESEFGIGSEAFRQGFPPSGKVIE